MISRRIILTAFPTLSYALKTKAATPNRKFDAASTNIFSPLGDFINVKEHGAVGDGFVDDSDAIQAAVDAADGGWVYLPKGEYLITRSIKYRNISGAQRSAGFKIFGDGKRLSILKNRVPNGFSIEIDTGIGSSAQNHFFSYGGKIINISIYGNNSVINSGGIRIKSCWEYEINCDILYHSADGLKITGDINLNPDYTASANTTLNQCRICENKIGINADLDNIAPLLTLNSCNISSNFLAGVYCNSSYLVIRGGTISYNGVKYIEDKLHELYGGVFISLGNYDPKGICIEGVEFDNNQPHHIHISQAKSPRIISCSFQSTKKNGYLNKFSIILGESKHLHKKYVEDWLIESNNFQLPEHIISNTVVHTFLKVMAYTRNGFLGFNSYSISDGIPGVNFLFLSEDKKTPPFDEERWRTRVRQQAGVRNSAAYMMQRHPGMLTKYE